MADAPTLFARLTPLMRFTQMRVRLFVREPEVLFWVLVFPLALALILGWAFRESAPSPETIGVLHAGETSALTQLINDDTLLEADVFADEEAAMTALRRGRIAVLLVVPPDWHAQAGYQTLTLRFDPQRPESELARLRLDRALVQAQDATPEYAVQEVQDTGSRYIDWLFPGLLGMNLMGTGIWSIGFAIADMRQKKLLRRFLVTPMPRSAFLWSFIMARGAFLVVELIALTAFAVWVLKVPMHGSVAGFAFVSLLGTLAFAALGLLVAARPRTIEGVSGLMNMAMLPMWLFSGVFFAYERFPEVAHPFLQALPLTALNDALRMQMLEGAGLVQLLPQLGVLLAWTVVSFALAIAIFRWE